MPLGVALGVSPVNRLRECPVVNSRAEGRRVADAGSIPKNQPNLNPAQQRARNEKSPSEDGLSCTILAGEFQGDAPVGLRNLQAQTLDKRP